MMTSRRNLALFFLFKYVLLHEYGVKALLQELFALMISGLELALVRDGNCWPDRDGNWVVQLAHGVSPCDCIVCDATLAKVLMFEGTAQSPSRLHRLQNRLRS